MFFNVVSMIIHEFLPKINKKSCVHITIFLTITKVSSFFLSKKSKFLLIVILISLLNFDLGVRSIKVS